MKKDADKSKIMGVPEPSVRRMPKYLILLRSMRDKGLVNISAPQIAQHLNMDPTQVVKDLSYTGARGRPKIGYAVEELINLLEDFLGYNKKYEAFLVGAGSLGSALLRYQGFTQTGLKVVAAFDTDKNIIGTEIAGVKVFDIEKFRDLASRLHITIGIITTPAHAAQNVTDLMVCWGIKAIWNFAPVSLKVPSHIIVQDTQMYSNLAVIMNSLKQYEDKQNI